MSQGETDPFPLGGGPGGRGIGQVHPPHHDPTPPHPPSGAPIPPRLRRDGKSRGRGWGKFLASFTVGGHLRAPDDPTNRGGPHGSPSEGSRAPFPSLSRGPRHPPDWGFTTRRQGGTNPSKPAQKLYRRRPTPPTRGCCRMGDSRSAGSQRGPGGQVVGVVPPLTSTPPRPLWRESQDASGPPPHRPAAHPPHTESKAHRRFTREAPAPNSSSQLPPPQKLRQNRVRVSGKREGNPDVADHPSLARNCRRQEKKGAPAQGRRRDIPCSPCRGLPGTPPAARSTRLAAGPPPQRGKGADFTQKPPPGSPPSSGPSLISSG
ncbi:hypothetical protein GWK47_026296 [Chionoecetes opilio]|uniref:Uncharacterized protein n=1 Tax=Chionoecetes opilio TaxID=41210 RepID=A0A8J8WAI3_CHIOP|nr:hypothetical protein GWK47_026296 [Chionoecetes opilio]